MVERTAVECGEYAQCRQWSTEIFTATTKTFGGEVRLPDLVILLHTKIGTQYSEHQAIIDSAKIGIPTIAIVDSDCNPNMITYPIPGNDDTLDSTQLYLHLFKQAILLGKKKRAEDINN
jgi:small subunit ribosomal protein S2